MRPGHSAGHLTSGRSDWCLAVPQSAPRVEAFANQVHAAIRDAQLELDIRIVVEERTGPRGDQRPSERRWHGHPKQAPHVLGNLDDVFSFFDGAQMGSHTFVIRGTLGSWAERARRTLQKAHAKTLL